MSSKLNNFNKVMQWVMTNMAIENGHRNRELSHEQHGDSNHSYVNLSEGKMVRINKLCLPDLEVARHAKFYHLRFHCRNLGAEVQELGLSPEKKTLGFIH